MTPPSWNPHFVGREVLLDTLREKLCETKQKEHNRRVALFGMGGVGKTQLTIEYIRRHEARYESVFWMQAKDRSTLQQYFQEMAMVIGCISSTMGLGLGEVAK